MSNQLSDGQILKELKSRLSKLLEEEKAALKEKEIRDASIQKTKIAIEAFSNADTIEILETPQLQQAKEEIEFVYPKDKTWQERIKAYMKFRDKVLTIAQIVEGVKEYETEYTEDKLHAAISNIVSTMVKNHLVRTYKPAIRMKGYYYGNPLWFENDELKEEYKPDLKEKLMW
ncbi:MAG: hypothetical protein JST21_00505 [Bacteroidetes bacterium]|nr:hypothetical protein [Bacteroidota bacterium]MBS1920793.1 hypothetical protein [Bacteroidota bacterium]MBS1930228.1 hypothetical protein [Bacteroidota bacterium]